MFPDLGQARGLRLAREGRLAVGHLGDDDDGADQGGPVRRGLGLGEGRQSGSVLPPGDPVVGPGPGDLTLHGPGLADHQAGLGPQDLHRLGGN